MNTILSFNNKDYINNAPQESPEEYEPQRESPEYILLSSETSSTHSENEAVCVSVVGASGITEVQHAATEKTETTEETATAVSSSSCANEEPLIKNRSKLLPVSTAYSGSKGISEDCWNREMAVIMHMLRESRQKEDSPQLERLALLLETSTLSRTELLSELSVRETSALTATLVKAFSNNWQSCKDQQQSSDTGSTQKKHTHIEERLEHNTHMHKKLSSRGKKQLCLSIN